MKKKTLRKIVVYLLILGPVAFFAFGWFDMNYLTDIDTAEVDHYYDVLSQKAKPAEALILSVGVREEDDLQIALRRMQEAMGLKKYDIDLVYGDQETPPAFVENTDNKYMTITVARWVKSRREQLNLLVHELSHVSVWSLEPSLLFMKEGTAVRIPEKSAFRGGNLERIVDTSGMFRGQGILTMNGLTDDMLFIPGIQFSTVQKMYGYLKPEQFGYLLARYCAEHGILPGNVDLFLNSAGRKYFQMGWHYLERSGRKPAAPSGKSAGVFWCPNGHPVSLDLSVPLTEFHCPQCAFHYRRPGLHAAVQDLLARVRK